jgi:predicted nucleic acid-binding protein
VIVVDASAVVDLLAGAPETDRLRGRVAEGVLQAPSLIDYEVVSAVRGLTLAGRLSATRAIDLLTDFDDLAVRRWPSRDALRRRALELREILSAYDAAYVVLAEALECPLVTRDSRLARSAGHGAVVEVW